MSSQAVQFSNNPNAEALITISSDSVSPAKNSTQNSKPQVSTSKTQQGSDSDLEEGEIIVKQVHSHTSDSEESSSPERPVAPKARSKQTYKGRGKFRDEDRREFSSKENFKGGPMNKKHENKFQQKPAPYYEKSKPYYSFEQKKPVTVNIPLHDMEKTQRPSAPQSNIGYQNEHQNQRNPNGAPANPPYYSQNAPSQPGYSTQGNQAPFTYSAPGSHNQPNQNIPPQYAHNTSSYYKPPTYNQQPNYNNPQTFQHPPPQNYNNMPNYQQNPQNNYSNPQGLAPNQPPPSFQNFNAPPPQYNAQALGFNIQFGASTNPPPTSQQPQYTNMQNVHGFPPGHANNTNLLPPGKSYNGVEASPSGYYNNSNQPNYSQPPTQPFNVSTPHTIPQPNIIQQQPPPQMSPFQSNPQLHQQQPSLDQGIYRPPPQFPQYGNPLNVQSQQPYAQPNQIPPRQPYQLANMGINQPNPMATGLHQPFVMQAGATDIIIKPSFAGNFSQPQAPEPSFPSYYKPFVQQQPQNENPNKITPPQSQDQLITISLPNQNNQEVNTKLPYDEDVFEVPPPTQCEVNTEKKSAPPQLVNPPDLSRSHSRSIPPPPEVAMKRDESQEKKVLAFFIDPVPIGTLTATADSEEHKGKKVETSKKIETEEKQYRLLGHDRWFRTQEKNLLEKLQKFLVPGENAKEEKKKEAVKEKESLEKEGAEGKDKEEEVDEFNFESRYFMYNPTQVCNRCKRPGHFEKWCTEESILRCMFCLGTHRLEDCTQIVCFNCYGMGHRIRDCTVQEPITCYRCGKKGHKNTRCGVLIPRDKELLKREKKDYNISTKCGACGSYGHPICTKNPFQVKSGYLDDMYIEENLTGEGNLKRDSSGSCGDLETTFDCSPQKRLKTEKKDGSNREVNI